MYHPIKTCGDPLFKTIQRRYRVMGDSQWHHPMNLQIVSTTTTLMMFPASLTRASEKRKACLVPIKPSQRLTQVAILTEPVDRSEEVVSHNRSADHVHRHVQGDRVSSLNPNTDFECQSGSELTAPPSLIPIHARPTSDGTGSDGDESLYQTADEENLSDVQVCSFNSTPPGISNSIVDR